MTRENMALLTGADHLPQEPQAEVVNRCGTYNGWSAHYRRGETPCDPCVAARREYQREWGARLTEEQREARHDYQRMWRRERDTALRELARRHRAEYLRILTEIRQEPSA